MRLHTSRDDAGVGVPKLATSLTSRINRKLGVVELVLGSLILAALTVVTLLQVVSRSVFEDPLEWSGEASRYLLVLLTFIGTAAVATSDSHIRLEPKWLNSNLMRRKVSHLLRGTLTTGGVVMLVGASFEFVGQMMALKSATLRIPLGLLYSVAAISLVLMAVQEFWLARSAPLAGDYAQSID